MSKMGRLLTLGLVGHGEQPPSPWRAMAIVFAAGLVLWVILR